MCTRSRNNETVIVRIVDKEACRRRCCAAARPGKSREREKEGNGGGIPRLCVEVVLDDRVTVGESNSEVVLARLDVLFNALRQVSDRSRFNMKENLATHVEP